MHIRKKFVCSGHRAALYALARDREDRHVITAGGDGWLVDWDLDDPETGRVIASVETQVFSLLTLPGRGWVVAGNMNGGVHWIDLEHPAQTRNIQHHQKGVYDIQTAGQWLYTAGGDGVLTRWDAGTGATVESFQLTNRALRAIAISGVRSEMAVGASDGAVYLLDLETLALKNTIPKAHLPSVFALAWSPDATHLLSGGRDAMLRVWNRQKEPALVSEQPAHWYTINHIVFSPDGKYFATASRDKTVKVWDAGSFQLLKVLDTIRDGGHINSVNRLLWLPGCLLSVSDDRTMIGWETPTERDGNETDRGG